VDLLAPLAGDPPPPERADPLADFTAETGAVVAPSEGGGPGAVEIVEEGATEEPVAEEPAAIPEGGASGEATPLPGEKPTDEQPDPEVFDLLNEVPADDPTADPSAIVPLDDRPTEDGAAGSTIGDTPLPTIEDSDKPPSADAIAAEGSDPPADDPPTNPTGGQVLIAEGEVYAHQDNGQWLDQHDVFDPDTDEKVKEDARKEAEGWADQVVYRLDTEDLVAQGNVRIKQPHQRATADALDYNKEKDLLLLEGNVWVRRRNKHDLASDRGALHLTSDVYEAFGNVESMTVLKKDEWEPDDEEGGPTLGDFPVPTVHERQFGDEAESEEGTAEPGDGSGTTPGE
ncbi:MAG TPA: LptA/OstA family protein, partial [bacterium]|nr:LptA/OstA family protein [bacterium]